MKIFERIIHMVKLLILMLQIAILGVFLIITLPLWIIPYEIVVRTRERKNNGKQ